MSTATITDIKTVLPAPRRATFKCFGPQNDEIASRWGWVDLHELASIVRVSFAQKDMGELRDFGISECDMSEDIFGRYGLLNDIGDGNPRFTWATLSTVNPVLVVYGKRPIHPPVDPRLIHVPALWGKNVVAAAEAGICRVTCSTYPTGVIIGPENKSYAGLRLVGHQKDGKEFWMYRNGDGGFSLAPMT